MFERDPQRIHNDEGRAPLAFTVDSARVQHYGDVVNHLVGVEIDRCKAEGFMPTTKQIDFLKKEIIRYAVIRRDVLTAQSIRIPKSDKLYEANDRLPTRP